MEVHLSIFSLLCTQFPSKKLQDLLLGFGLGILKEVCNVSEEINQEATILRHVLRIVEAGGDVGLYFSDKLLVYGDVLILTGCQDLC